MEVVADAIHDDRVPRVIPARTSRADIGLAAQDVDELPLAFIAPLTSENHGRHGYRFRFVFAHTAVRKSVKTNRYHQNPGCGRR